MLQDLRFGLRILRTRPGWEQWERELEGVRSYLDRYLALQSGMNRRVTLAA